MNVYGRVERIRAAVQARVDATTLRRVATAVGLQPNTVKGFLEGAIPHERNLKKYETFLEAGQKDPPSRRFRLRERAEVDAAVEALRLYVNSDPRKSERDRRWREISRRIYGAERLPD